ncbi:hypothetical protein CEXT_156481 [Caerostris extrusa]|uniref:Uncharacterized protein n=1 Tax=Caerostris extrusa TaxID=172846 RepID=A0AAV4TU99_CAEEX|nr:hypothetical protein CEXT_156481 [Caerostris extrusa]
MSNQPKQVEPQRRRRSIKAVVAEGLDRPPSKRLSTLFAGCNKNASSCLSSGSLGHSLKSSQVNLFEEEPLHTHASL